MSYDEACEALISTRAALAEIKAHSCEHMVRVTAEGLVDVDTGELFAPYSQGLIRGLDVLSWLGY